MSKQIPYPFCSASPQLPHNLFFHLFAKKCPLTFVNIALTTLPYTLVHPNAAPCNCLGNERLSLQTFPLGIFMLLQGLWICWPQLRLECDYIEASQSQWRGLVTEWFTHQSHETLHQSMQWWCLWCPCSSMKCKNNFYQPVYIRCIYMGESSSSCGARWQTDKWTDCRVFWYLILVGNCGVWMCGRKCHVFLLSLSPSTSLWEAQKSSFTHLVHRHCQHTWPVSLRLQGGRGVKPTE